MTVFTDSFVSQASLARCSIWVLMRENWRNHLNKKHLLNTKLKTDLFISWRFCSFSPQFSQLHWSQRKEVMSVQSSYPWSFTTPNEFSSKKITHIKIIISLFYANPGSSSATITDSFTKIQQPNKDNMELSMILG